MMDSTLNTSFRHVLRMHIKYTYLFVPKRFRYKPKWAVHDKPLTNCQQALGNFDAFYKPVYGKHWPSIRVSLLSLPKYCAAVNKYGNVSRTEERLWDIGASNFLLNLNTSFQNQIESELSKVKSEIQNHDFNAEQPYISPLSENDNAVNPDTFNEDLVSSISDNDLNVFIPTEKVYSERDLLVREEINLNTFESRDVTAQVLPPEALTFPKDVQPFVFSPGDVSRFPSPKSQSGITNYYLMDAASVLPVLALNIQPDDTVLDLCAAPGGKSYLIMQSLDLQEGGFLHCNDVSQARLARLRSVLSMHFPRDLVEKIKVTKMTGTSEFPTGYDKVLVDVPCNSDRHVVTEDENNLFKISRTRERLGLTFLQKELLLSGIRACSPGGTIVYSTCTLAPAQNDGVIQAAIEELYETSEIEVAVQDLSNLQQALSDTFQFYSSPKHGLTVLPTLLNNFGPSYFAKLRRVK